MTNEEDYIELGLAWADVRTGLDGKLLKNFNNSVHGAINQLTV